MNDSVFVGELSWKEYEALVADGQRVLFLPEIGRASCRERV